MSEKYTLDRLPLTGSRDIDEKTRVLYGTQVAKLGEASTHGVALDDVTLDQIVALGNAAPDGVKTRFNHPSMCTPALGSFVGTRSNFRREGDYVQADLYLSDAAKKETIDHILAMAKNHPDQFGSSIVVTADSEERDGKGPDGKALLPLLRVEKLHAVDLVDDPASGDGMFGAAIEGVAFSATEMVGIRHALNNKEFVQRAQGIIEHQAKVLGLSTGAVAIPVNDVAAERGRVAYVMRFSKGKSHLQASTNAYPDGLMAFAIENEMSTVDFLEAVIDLDAKALFASNGAGALALLESASNDIQVESVEPSDRPSGAVPMGTLQETFFARFVKLGYPEDQAKRMAAEAAERK